MRLVSAIVLAVLAPAAAHETPPPGISTLFQDYGLFGEWAVDCKAKASPGNPHVTIADTQGTVIERHDLGSDYSVNAYRVLEARRLSANRIAVEALFQPGGGTEQRQDLVFSVRDKTRRTVFTKVEGGPVRVQDGRVVGYGIATPRLKKCG